MNKNIDPQKLSRMFGDKSTEGINKAINSGDASALLSSLSASDRKMFEQLLNNKGAVEQLLSSPEAIRLISELMGQ